jgi:hypothetical protein
MKHLKMLGLGLAAAAIALMTVGANSASATTLEVGGVAQNKSVSFTWTLKSGTSMVFEGVGGGFFGTCTGLEVKGATEGTFTGSTVGGKLSSFTWSGCRDTTDTDNPGRFQIAWSSGTNGTVTLSETQFTWFVEAFGTTFTCKLGSGADLGTLTGSKEGQAAVDMNALVDCGGIVLSLKGVLTVTSPSGLGVVS